MDNLLFFITFALSKRPFRKWSFRNKEETAVMRFFDRDKEIEFLKEIFVLSRRTAQFTMMTGRRRIGKTSLVLKAYEGETLLYFFVSRKAETELCNSFVAEIEEKLGIPMLGSQFRFADIFEYLMKLSQRQHITLFIDEFQEFFKVNKSVFSDMQRIWDLNKGEAHINLIVCGSVNSMMNKMFRDKKEPLYGRNTQMLKLKAFRPTTLKEILQEYAPEYNNEDLLALYLYTGGVAKYVEQLIDNGHYTSEAMLNAIVQPNSMFIDEGKAMLIEEFGRDYGIYFTILSLIAQGHNTRGDIEGILKQEIGGYLTKLLDDYELITKQQPLFEKSANKNVHYAIQDNFLCFWFRFIYKYNYMIEVEAFQKLKAIVQRDYETYSGMILEKYFRNKIMEQAQYTRIGSWHDRRGENEIDIIAADDLTEKVDFYEVKHHEKNIELGILRSKADAFFKATGQYTAFARSYHGLSINDM